MTDLLYFFFCRIKWGKCLVCPKLFSWSTYLAIVMLLLRYGRREKHQKNTHTNGAMLYFIPIGGRVIGILTLQLSSSSIWEGLHRSIFNRLVDESENGSAGSYVIQLEHVNSWHIFFLFKKSMLNLKKTTGCHFFQAPWKSFSDNKGYDPNIST